MRNITALLKAAGAGFEHVVRTTVFLADMNDFAAMNDVYAKHIVDPPPARATVQVAPPAARREDRNRRHRGALVERSARPRVFRPAHVRARPSHEGSSRDASLRRRQALRWLQEATLESRVLTRRYKGNIWPTRWNGGRSSAMPARADQEEQCAPNS